MASRITMTRCAGGEHVTLIVTDEKGGTRLVPMLYSELAAMVPAEEDREAKDEALRHAVKETIKAASARDFSAMKQAIEAAEYEKAVAVAEPPIDEAGEIKGGLAP